MVEDQVDPGTRGQRGEFLEELDRLEEEVGSAVGPLALEKHEHAPVAGELEAILGHRRSQDVCVAVTSTRNIVLPSSRAGLCTQAPTVPSGGWTARGGRGG